MAQDIDELDNAQGCRSHLYIQQPCRTLIHLTSFATQYTPALSFWHCICRQIVLLYACICKLSLCKCQPPQYTSSRHPQGYSVSDMFVIGGRSISIASKTYDRMQGLSGMQRREPAIVMEQIMSFIRISLCFIHQQ